jgi:hypothetical protein
MARNRALHADLVILVRHALGLSENAAAAKFEKADDRFRALLKRFVERAGDAERAEAGRVSNHLNSLADHWGRRADAAETQGGLIYRGTRKDPRLLKKFLDEGDAWETLDSMRSVDLEIPVRITGADR